MRSLWRFESGRSTSASRWAQVSCASSICGAEGPRQAATRQACHGEHACFTILGRVSALGAVGSPASAKSWRARTRSAVDGETHTLVGPAVGQLAMRAVDVGPFLIEGHDLVVFPLEQSVDRAAAGGEILERQSGRSPLIPALPATAGPAPTRHRLGRRSSRRRRPCRRVRGARVWSAR